MACVYQHLQSTFQDAPYRIFGMNFYKQYGDDLILEDVWGTPGKNGEGEWKKRVRRDEFQIMRDSRLCDVKMFFSLEEFVLYGTSERLLRPPKNKARASLMLMCHQPNGC